MITGTPVPTTGMLSRSQLDITERYVGTEEYMTMTARSDSWIDKLGQTGGCLSLDRKSVV